MEEKAINLNYTQHNKRERERETIMKNDSQITLDSRSFSFFCLHDSACSLNALDNWNKLVVIKKFTHKEKEIN